MIYLDNAATTKPSKDAINKATIFNEEEYFNPSALYLGGLAVNRQIKEAKQTIISALSANPDKFDVVFTSCGSESDNTAVLCVKKRGLFVTTKGEHSAIYQSFLELKNRGVDIYLAELNADGTVNVASLLDLKLDDAVVINDVISFLKNFPKEEELWVVGGATIYKFSLPYADNLYITHVDGEYEGDAYFPKFDLENEFKLISSRISNNLNFAVYERV